MNSNALSKIAAMGGAASTFVGGMLTFPTNFVGDLALSSILAIATGMGILYFWPSKKAATKKEVREMLDAIDAVNKGTMVSNEEVINAIRTGTEKLDRMLLEAAQIKSPNTTRRIKRIDSIGRKIIEDFRIDPNDVRLAQSWLNSYLDETIKLVKGYAHLSKTGTRSIEAQTKMAEFEDVLTLIEDNFKKLLDKLLSNDTMDFDVNMTVMQNRLNNEGM